jgi:hypothetical protein
MWRVVPYKIHGVSLFSVEKDGYIWKYCDTRKEAQDYCDELNA